MVFRHMIHLREYLLKIYPQQFQSCFLDWMKSIQKITEGEVVALDGKTLQSQFHFQAQKAAGA